MGGKEQPLWRPQVLARQAERLSGEVVIALPISWQLIGYSLISALGVLFVFLLLASYSRVETVTGSIAPDKGIAVVIPSRPGVVSSVNVKYGDRVSQGTVLAEISVEEHLVGGGSAADRIESAVGRQGASLAAQLLSAREASEAQLAQLSAEKAGATAEITQLNAQLGIQKELVASAQADYESSRALMEKGFISTRDLKQREDGLLGRRQQLAQLEQLLAARTAVLKGMERNAAAIAAQTRAQAASLDAVRAQIDQQTAATQIVRSYVMRAPVSGRVTALTARVGKAATTQQPLMSIVPEDATLRAELSVPTNAIAFIRTGQDVLLAIDAFPYQRFGTIKGRVTTISESATTERSGTGSSTTYPVIVDLTQQSIGAFGKEFPLVPDMTLSARIVTERQSLFEWLFEPFFAVRQR